MPDGKFVSMEAAVVEMYTGRPATKFERYVCASKKPRKRTPSEGAAPRAIPNKPSLVEIASASVSVHAPPELRKYNLPAVRFPVPNVTISPPPSSLSRSVG